MKHAHFSRLALSTLTLIFHFGKAATIVSTGAGIVADGPAIYAGQYASACWAQRQAYSNVSIAAPIFLFTAESTPNPTGVYHGAAYLTSSIGPGISSAIATTSFSGNNTSPQQRILFSGLTLEPGTYCLTLAGTDDLPPGTSSLPVGYIWSASPGFPSIMVAPGVGVGIIAFASRSCGLQTCLNQAFPPASALTPTLINGSESYLQFTVTGESSFIYTNVGSLAHIVSGGGWTTTLTIVSTDTSVAQVGIYFLDNDGYPLQLPITSPQSSVTPVTTNKFISSLAPGAELIIQTTGPATGPIQQGSVNITSNGSITGFATFGTHVGDIVQQAVVPLETRSRAAFVVPFDNTNNYVTGIALTDLGAPTSDVTVVIRDDMGAALLNTSINLGHQGHTAFAVPLAYPVTAGRRGTLELSRPNYGAISAIGLLFAPSNSFSTIPVAAK
jgi:hypothetical protein